MEEQATGGFGFSAGKWPLDTDKSTIVFIHAAGVTGHFWRAQVQGLSGRVNTVAIDLPGHGRSGGHARNRIEDYARTVVDFMDAIAVLKPIPCGLSMGGAIAQQLLLDYSERFRAGILIGSGAKLRVLPTIFEDIKNNYADFVDMLCKLASSEKTDPDVIQPFRADLSQCQPEVTCGDFQACDGFDVMQRLDEIKVPVLVISAEDDKLTPAKYAEFLINNIPKAVRRHITDAGHLMPMEKPDEVNQAIIDFLNRHGL